MNSRILLIICFFSIALPALAQKEKNDSLRLYNVPAVTVTTSRAIERRTPVPFSEITKSDIQVNYTTLDITHQLTDLPSIMAYSQNGNWIGYSNLTMRGFDQRRIAVMINGIPQNDPEDHGVYWVDFPDISSSLENVQVQRGAGLTTFGAASIGGSINLTTSNFANEKFVKLNYGVGYQHFGAEDKYIPITDKSGIEVSSGLVGKYALYGRLSMINTQGYRDGSYAKLNSFFLSTVRFDSNLTTQINVFGGPFSDGLVYNGLPKSYMNDLSLRRQNFSYFTYDSTGKNLVTNYNTPRRKQEIEEFSQPHIELLNDWKINEKFNFLSTLFYYTGSGFYDYNGAGWTTAQSFRMTKAQGYDTVDAADPKNALIRGFVGNKQWGWIPRIVWEHGDGQFTAGAELRFHRSEHWGKIRYAENLPDGFNPDYRFYYNNGERDIMSAFVREQYNLTKDLTLNLEGQFVRQSLRLRNIKEGNIYATFVNNNGESITNGSTLFNINYYFFNPRIGANWNINDYQNIYLMAAYTSREPRMRNLYAADDSFFGAYPLFERTLHQDNTYRYNFDKPIAKPERMIDIELGSNYRTDKYFASVNFYLMEYSDEFVKTGNLDINGNPIDVNAPRTRHFGVELQASAEVMNFNYGKLVLSGNSTISRNRLVEYNLETNSGESVSLKDNPIAGFPDFMANLRLSYLYMDLYLSFICKYLGDFRTDNFGDMLSNPVIMRHLTSNPYNILYYTDNKVESSTVFNADISYTFRNILSMQSIRLRCQIINLFDKIYTAGGEGKEFFPAAERSFFIGVELGL
ncbi:MAG: TonB-dependent receptor plug [Ignavibacteria bacterium]|nr:TonB-dependent receptor plug [Ignavibacteria bacterium]